MRYTEPKTRSAELLRLALAQMGRHDAAFNPVTFTVWYEYVAGINARLNAALDQATANGTPIDDTMVQRLYREHVAPPEVEAMERIGNEMQRLMSGMAQSASQAGHSAGTFGAQLDDLSAALATHGARDVAELTPHLNRMLAGTAQMKDSVQALQQRVRSSHDEIELLRGELSRARDEALLDPLTGVLNRRGFDQKLKSLLAEPVADGESHCLVMLDIDHFKAVNDTHGHLMGDKVIQAVGEILRATVTDAACAPARYGGEEFAILLPKTTARRSLELAEDVRRRTKAMRIRDRRTQEVLVAITISGGVTALKSGDDASALIARADAALYASKQGGRDRVTLA